MRITKWPQHLWVWIAAAFAVGTWELGIAGWRDVNPELRWDELAYRSFQLFTASSDAPNPPALLAWARMLAVGVSLFALGSIVAMLYSSVADWVRRGTAKRARCHLVILGDGPEALDLATSPEYLNPGRPVVAIGHYDPDERAQLASKRVTAPVGLDDDGVAAVLHDADEVIAIGSDDAHTAKLVTDVARWLASSSRPTPRVTALFDSPLLARQWRQDSHDQARAVSRISRVAVETLRRCPPFPADAVVPDPIVVGGGPLAAELVRRIVTGWQHDGWRPRVHCLTDDPSWTPELIQHYSSGTMLVEPMTVTPECVAATVQQIVGAWTPPIKRRGRPGGVRVFLALEHPDIAVTIARRLAEVQPVVTPVVTTEKVEVPGPHVGLVVDEEDIWDGLLQDVTDRVTLIARNSLLASPVVLDRDETALLGDELRRDAESWPPEAPGLFGRHLVSDSEHHLVSIVPQPDRLERGVSLLTDDGAQAALKVLMAGGLTATIGLSHHPAPLLNPGQLRSMAQALRRALREALPDDATDEEVRLWCLELANRLPQMMQRAGWVVTSGQPGLGYDDIETLARHTHSEYLDAQRRGRYGTGSELATTAWEDLPEHIRAGNRAQVMDYPVKLAYMHLDWRPSTASGGLHLSEEATDFLAIAEHRRWQHFQRRNGSGEHAYCIPWEDLSAVAHTLDRNVVTTMGRSLASIGLEICAPQDIG